MQASKYLLKVCICAISSTTNFLLANIGNTDSVYLDYDILTVILNNCCIAANMWLANIFWLCQELILKFKVKINFVLVKILVFLQNL